MKKIVVSVLAISSLLISSCTSKTGVGYFNSNELLACFPESKNIDSTLKVLNVQLNNQLSLKNQDFQTKLQAYFKDSATLSPDIKEEKIKSLRELESEVKKYQEEANILFANKRKELTDTLFKRIQAAVEDVAKTKGYSIIFDSGTTPFIYKNEGDDLLPILKIKLGVK